MRKILSSKGIVCNSFSQETKDARVKGSGEQKLHASCYYWDRIEGST